MSLANSTALKAQAQTFRIAAKTALLKRGLTVSGLARDLGLARNTVSIAINHPSMLPGVKCRIAEALGFSFP